MLRKLAEKIEKHAEDAFREDVLNLEEAALAAREHAETLSGLIDGEDDELGQLLGPIRDFLVKLSPNAV